MTASVTTKLQKLLRHRVASSISQILRAVLRPVLRSARREHDATAFQPTLFRSEGFAEDLFDAYPSH